MWFFGKKRAKKKALQEEQLKMQQESMRNGDFAGGKPIPSIVLKEAEVKPVPTKKEKEKFNLPKEEKKSDPLKIEKLDKKDSTKKSTEEKKNKKYHVSQNKDAKSNYYKQWRVRKEGSSKTIKYFETQAEAIDYAEDLADKNDSSIVIHKLDGSIRKQEY